ncbi:MAG: methyl-accepting chemotaxis protein [Rhodospirillaceae bacterium]
MIRMFGNLSLRIKLFIAPALIILAMGVLGYTSYQAISRQDQALVFLYKTSLAKKDAVTELRTTVISVNIGLYKALNWQEIGVKEEKIKALLDETLEQIKAVERLVAALRKDYAYGAEEAPFLARVETGAAAYVKAARDTLDMVDTDAVVAATLLADAERRFATVAGVAADWAAFQKRDADALYTATEDAGRQAIAAFVVIVSLSLAVSLLATLGIGGAIARAIAGVTEVMNRLAGGDLTVEVPPVRSGDEIGTMIEAVQVFKDTALDMERMRAEQDALREAGEEARIVALEQMADTVERESRNAVAEVVEKTGDMTAKAEAMAGIALRVGTNSEEVAAAANQALANAQTVAAACEELTAAIGEIGRLVSQASATTRSSVEYSREAELTIQTLSESVGRIGEFTNMIAEIASQTNLLALNATIEAARAGAAGKGFAVVASEVKALAGQTATATKEITRQIDEVRAITRTVVDAVTKVGAQIVHIDEISASVAAAIEEEGSATNEISRNVTETAAAAQEVSRRIEQVAADAQTTMTTAMVVCEAASTVADNVAHLRSVLVQVVRTSTKEANRRRTPRYRVELPGEVDLAGARRPVTVRDISVSGAQIDQDFGVPANSQGGLILKGYGRHVPFRVVGIEGGATHVRFDLNAGDQVNFCRFFEDATEGQPLAA